MIKRVLQTFLIIFAIALINPNSIVHAVDGGGSCVGTRNECLCHPDNPNCCAIEGPTGYNCGGGGTTTTVKNHACVCGKDCEVDDKTGREKCSGCITCCSAQPIPAPIILKAAPTSNGIAINWLEKQAGNQAYETIFMNNHIYFDKNYSNVNANCVNVSCLINIGLTGITRAKDTAPNGYYSEYSPTGGNYINYYTYTGGALDANTTYYLKIVRGYNGKNRPGCNQSDSTSVSPSCSFSPTSANINTGGSQVFTLKLGAANTSFINPIDYESDKPNVAKVTASTQSSPFYATLLAIANGIAKLTATVSPIDSTSPTISCQATANVVTPVTLVTAWWSTQDSDVLVFNDLTNPVPTGLYMNANGGGGYPGVATYGTTTTLTNANISTKGWLTNDLENVKTYSYQYLVNLIPKTTTINALTSSTLDLATLGGVSDVASNGYYYYKFDATEGSQFAGQNLTITSGNIGTKKIILLVDSADINITGNMNLTDGQGFFMILGNQNLMVDPAVFSAGAAPSIEGFYFVENEFKSGVGSKQLHVRGAVAANSGIILNRDLGAGNITTPSELFEYAPDQAMLFPKDLTERRLRWKEVAP